ncbi:hypothetical protein AAVH_16886 [Aphelenchoides avenae]|nr:hypothetical protein AAVH_16886 [Aphelenchus avenae]
MIIEEMHLHYRRKFSENPVDSSENYDVESQVAKYMNDSLVYRIRVRVDLLNGCGIEPGHVLQAWLDLNGRRLLYVASKRFEQNLKALRAMVPDQLSVSELRITLEKFAKGLRLEDFTKERWLKKVRIVLRKERAIVSDDKLAPVHKIAQHEMELMLKDLLRYSSSLRTTAGTGTQDGFGNSAH